MDRWETVQIQGVVLRAKTKLWIFPGLEPEGAGAADAEQEPKISEVLRITKAKPKKFVKQRPAKSTKRPNRPKFAYQQKPQAARWIRKPDLKRKASGLRVVRCHLESGLL